MSDLGSVTGNEERAGRFIVLAHAGWWTLHYESFRTRESADREAAGISAKTLVLDVEDVGSLFGDRGHLCDECEEQICPRNCFRRV